jgi:hypothetical protein
MTARAMPTTAGRHNRLSRLWLSGDCETPSFAAAFVKLASLRLSHFRTKNRIPLFLKVL